MNPITRNPKPIFHGEGPFLDRIQSRRGIFSPLHHTHTLCNGVYVIGSKYQTRGEAFAALECSFPFKFRPFLKSLTHSFTVSFFTFISHSCNRRLNRVQNTPTCCTVAGRGEQTLAYLRRDEPHLHAHTLRKQALRPGLSHHTIASNRASFRRIPRSVVAQMAQNARRRLKNLAETLGTVSLKEIYA